MSNSKGRIINLLGGPCARKTTWRAKLFVKLREEGIECEEITEWIKKPLYEGRNQIVRHQAYVFGKQLHATDCVLGQTDVAITDSPVALCAFYGRKYSPDVSDLLYQGMIEEFKRRGGCNIFLRRVGPYQQIGRIQTAEEADADADALHKFLLDHDIEFTEFRADEDARIIAQALEYANGL